LSTKANVSAFIVSDGFDVPVETVSQNTQNSATPQPLAIMPPTHTVSPATSTTQTPTNTLMPELYLDQNYYCREQPDRYSEEVWTFSKGKTLKV